MNGFIGRIRPQVAIIAIGLIGVACYLGSIGLTEIAGVAVGGLCSIATKLVEKDDED
jgi:L-serine deaminase